MSLTCVLCVFNRNFPQAALDFVGKSMVAVGVPNRIRKQIQIDFGVYMKPKFLQNIKQSILGNLNHSYKLIFFTVSVKENNPDYSCKKCSLPINDTTQESIYCDCCLQWFHFKCEKLKYKFLSSCAI